jgi:formylglycine-generating enzyme required for sulfatase activity
MVAYTPTAKAATTPAGMVHIPANPSWTFACTAAMYSNFDVQFPFEPAPTTTHSAVLNVPAFYMDVSPVTNAQFAGFLNSSGYAPLDTHNFLRDWASPSSGPPSGWGAKPVTWVDLEDAGAYCTHYGKRLPNDWEWQYAFQGNSNTTYPWGNAFNASCAPVQTHDNVRAPPPDVGGYPSCASPFGVQDGMGLVWQWTNEFQDFRTGVALIRGGSYWVAQGSDWYPKNNIHDATTTTLRTHNMLRLMDASYDRHGTVGFRCVQDSA